MSRLILKACIFIQSEHLSSKLISGNGAGKGISTYMGNIIIETFYMWVQMYSNEYGRHNSKYGYH